MNVGSIWPNTDTSVSIFRNRFIFTRFPKNPCPLLSAENPTITATWNCFRFLRKNIRHSIENTARRCTIFLWQMAPAFCGTARLFRILPSGILFLRTIFGKRNWTLRVRMRKIIKLSQLSFGASSAFPVPTFVANKSKVESKISNANYFLIGFYCFNF